MNKKEIEKEFRDRFSELKKLLNSWDLIPGAPSDEFDGLNQQILNHLYKGANIEKLERVLEGELVVTYGLFNDDLGIEELTAEIMKWRSKTNGLSDNLIR